MSSLVAKCSILYFAGFLDTPLKIILQYELFRWTKESIFFLTKYPVADDSTSRVFPLYVNKFSLKQSWLSQFCIVVIKKCMNFVCGLVASFAITLAWGFRYLKINCNLSAKSKLNCRRLSTKLPKNTRHDPIVEKSETFFLMRLLQWNVQSSCPGVQ